VSLLFTVGVTLLSGIFAGLLPALFGTRAETLLAVKETTRSLGGAATRTRLRSVLLTAEVSLTVVLLIGAGLLLKSFAELRSVKMGCATENVLTMGVSLPEAKYDYGPPKVHFFEDLLSRVRAIPDVSAAGVVTVLPGNGHYEDNTFKIEGHAAEPGEFLDATVRAADPDYFRAMNVPLLRGRYFTGSDQRKNSNGMVISESMAKKFFSNQDPVGKTLILDWDGAPHYEIVGIVGDVISNLDRLPEPTMYVPLNEGRHGYGSLIVRSSHDATVLALPIQKEVAAIDPDLPVSDVLTMEQIIGRSASRSAVRRDSHPFVRRARADPCRSRVVWLAFVSRHAAHQRNRPPRRSGRPARWRVAHDAVRWLTADNCRTHPRSCRWCRGGSADSRRFVQRSSARPDHLRCCYRGHRRRRACGGICSGLARLTP